MLRIGRCTRVLLARCGGTEAQGRGGGGGRGGRRGYGAGGSAGGDGGGGSSKALPKLCVEGFDVSVGGRALDDDKEGVLRQDCLSLDVVPNTRDRSARALREAGREVNERGLLKAAEEGDVSLVKLYLDAGVPIDCVDRDETPLYYACRGGSVEVARLLLDRGSTAIDKKSDFTKETPLQTVCRRLWHVGIARLLLDRGSTSINKKSGFLKRTPLHDACAAGHVELATLLLDRSSTATDEEGGSKSLLQAKDADGETPLHNACRYGHVEIVRLLLDRGAAIDEKDKNGQTAFNLACERGKVEVARLLLDRVSTAIAEKGYSGYTPLHTACLRGKLELATLLLDRSSAATDEEGGSKSLLQVKSDHGETPFHLACNRGHVEIARLLLDRGAAIDERDDSGETPLHHACREFNWEVARLLLDRGSTAVDVENHDGKTPLRSVEECGDEELAKLMRAQLTEKSQARPCPAEATDGAAPKSTKRRRVVEE